MNIPYKRHGFELIYFPVIDSTNDFLKTRVSYDGKCDLLSVRADEQTHGRGRGRNRFESPREGLYFSVLDRGIDIERLPLYASWVSYIASSFLKSLGFPVKLKEPNDIILDNRKLGGVLVESATNQNRVTWTIAGLGMNINNSFDSLPYISLKDYHKKDYDINTIYLDILSLWWKEREFWFKNTIDYFKRESDGN